MAESTTIKPGRYRHYKGKEYTVIGVARHSETLDELVVYRPEYGEQGLWVRPKAMFFETVMADGQTIPRFQPIASTVPPIPARVKNIAAGLPHHLPKEVIEILANSAEVRIERIVSHGQASPADFWYDQPEHEWVLVVNGAARLQFENETVEMTPGDFITIPAHCKHRVDWTTPSEPTIWLAVFYT